MVLQGRMQPIFTSFSRTLAVTVRSRECGASKSGVAVPDNRNVGPHDFMNRIEYHHAHNSV